MSTIPLRPAPGLRAEYRRFLPMSLRWMDNDVFGHVNNAHYYSLFDTAVCEFLVGRGVLTWRASDHFMVVAESGCRYHSEVAFPDQITAGLRVVRLGTSSVRYDIGVFRNEDDSASAEGFMVHVCVAAASRRPAPMPEHWRAVLEQLVVED
jgi:acyl-CoA thioester hydrolase